MKQYGTLITNQNTTSPGDALLKRYREKLHSNRPYVNYKKLVNFQWPEKKAFTHRKSSDTLAITKRLLEAETFEREDYLELTKLVYLFLTDEQD